MSRSRKVNTDISIEKRLNGVSDFAALLYTWMIPHAKDDCRLPRQDPEELRLLIVPGRRNTEADVALALKELCDCEIIGRDEEGDYFFPAVSFYKYQSYINKVNRRPTPCMCRKQQETAENSISPSPSPSLSKREDKNNTGYQNDLLERARTTRMCSRQSVEASRVHRLARLGVPLPEWLAFSDMRHQIANPMTQEVEDMEIETLETLANSGEDASECLHQAIIERSPHIHGLRVIRGGKKNREHNGRHEEIDLPEWVNRSIWQEYLAVRAHKRATKLTRFIAQQLFKKIDLLADLGYDRNGVLTTMVERSWLGLEIAWVHKPVGRNGNDEVYSPNDIKARAARAANENKQRHD